MSVPRAHTCATTTSSVSTQWEHIAARPNVDQDLSPASQQPAVKASHCKRADNPHPRNCSLTCSAVQPPTLFWCELPNFGAIGCRDICLLFNVMEQEICRSRCHVPAAQAVTQLASSTAHLRRMVLIIIIQSWQTHFSQSNKTEWPTPLTSNYTFTVCFIQGTGYTP